MKSESTEDLEWAKMSPEEKKKTIIFKAEAYVGSLLGTPCHRSKAI